MISFKRINAVLLQEWYVSKRALEVIMDLLFFSVLNLCLFGFLSLYLLGTNQILAGEYLLLGAVGWEVIRITQYSMTVSSLWNVWSRNLSNMFITPLSLTEFIVSQMWSGMLKSAGIVLGLLGVTALVFHFNIFALGWITLLFAFVNLVMFAWTVGLLLLGLIFRYGVRIQALGWAMIYVFQPLCAAYFPVSMFPPVLQGIAYTLPPTYVFEALRFSMNSGGVNWLLEGQGLIINIVYFVITLFIFRWLYQSARNTGQFARNES